MEEVRDPFAILWGRGSIPYEKGPLVTCLKGVSSSLKGMRERLRSAAAFNSEKANFFLYLLAAAQKSAAGDYLKIRRTISTILGTRYQQLQGHSLTFNAKTDLPKMLEQIRLQLREPNALTDPEKEARLIRKIAQLVISANVAEPLEDLRIVQQFVPGTAAWIEQESRHRVPATA